MARDAAIRKENDSLTFEYLTSFEFHMNLRSDGELPLRLKITEIKMSP